MVQTAKIRKCKTIIGIDRIPSRIQLAKELGATHTIDTSPVGFNVRKAICDIYPTGVDCVIDTTGTPAIIEDGLRALRKRGKLVLIGVPPMQYELSISAIQQINVCLPLRDWT